MINVEVKRGGSESSIGLLRRFSKQVQNAGILPRMRGIRYSSRNISENVRRKKTLKRLAQKKKITELIKLGKIQENVKRKRR
jgi:ribosomal protein S21